MDDDKGDQDDRFPWKDLLLALACGAVAVVIVMPYVTR